MKEKLAGFEQQNQSLLQEVNGLKGSQKALAEVEILQQSSTSNDESSKLSAKLLDTEAQLSQTQTSMKELLSQVEKKNSEIQVHLDYLLYDSVIC